MTLSKGLDRLREIKDLEEGWLWGAGERVTTLTLVTAVVLLWYFWVLRVPIPYLYPTETGGILCEWSFTHDDVQVGPGAKVVVWRD